MAQLNEKEIEFYVKYGYLVLRNALPIDLIEEARGAILKVIGPWVESEGQNSKNWYMPSITDPSSLYHGSRPQYTFRSDASPIMALAMCSEVRGIADCLFEPGARPDVSSIVNWYRWYRNEGHRPTPHIDTPPGPSIPMPYQIGTLAVPIWAEGTLESGYTLVFPGSHFQVEKWLDDHQGVHLEDWREDISGYGGRRDVRIPFETEGGTALLLKPGDIFILHSLLAHAAVSPQPQGIRWRSTALFRFRNPTGEVLTGDDIFSGHSDVVRMTAASLSYEFKSTVSWKRNDVCAEIEGELSRRQPSA